MVALATSKEAPKKENFFLHPLSSFSSEEEEKEKGIIKF